MTSGHSSGTSDVVLEFRGIAAGYGRTGVLTDVEWQVRRGTVVGLLGPNGAGKTTILRTLCGQTTVTDGEVILNDKPVTSWRTFDIARLGIAHVVEGRGILAGMSVLDNLLIGAYGRGGDTGTRLKAVYELFPRLRERATQRAETLSGGEQQMLAIGRGLMMDPVVMLLDEPSQGLSPLLVEMLLASIRAVRDRGVTIVIVEQSPDLLARLVDEVIFVAGGRTSKPLGPAVLKDSDILASVLAQGILPGSDGQNSGSQEATPSLRNKIPENQRRQPGMETR